MIVSKSNSLQRKFAMLLLIVSAADQCIAFESSYHIEQGSFLYFIDCPAFKFSCLITIADADVGSL